MHEDLIARFERLERLVAELSTIMDRQFAYLAHGFVSFHDSLKDLEGDMCALRGVLQSKDVIDPGDIDAVRAEVDQVLSLEHAVTDEFASLHQFRARLEEELKRLEQPRA